MLSGEDAGEPEAAPRIRDGVQRGAALVQADLDAAQGLTGRPVGDVPEKQGGGQGAGGRESGTVHGLVLRRSPRGTTCYNKAL